MSCSLQVKSGMDDMRQDAVMQQFFALINNVLQESPDTQKRKLRIVTYKVHTAPMLFCQFCMEQACHVNFSVDISCVRIPSKEYIHESGLCGTCQSHTEHMGNGNLLHHIPKGL